MDPKTAYPQTGLPLPEKTSDAVQILSRDETLRQWLEQLPLADSQETARLLLKLLLDAGTSEINSLQRLKQLEYIQTVTEQVVSGLEKKFIPSQFPLSNKKHQAALLARELYLQTAICYKLVFAGQIDSSSTVKDKNQHVIALHRCLYYLERVVTYSAMMYEPYPPHIWQEIHLLFTYCSINKLDRIAVENNPPRVNQSTIKQLYKRVLLFAVASPYSLGQHDMLTLLRLLPAIDDKAGLVVTEPAEQKNDIGFFINLHGDSPPIHVARIPENSHTRTLILQTGKLLKLLQQSLTGSCSIEELNNAPLHLKQALLKNWGYTPQRHFKRTGLNPDIRVVTDLYKIHQFIERTAAHDNLADALTNKPQLVHYKHRSADVKKPFNIDDSSVLTMGANEFNDHEQQNSLMQTSPDRDRPIDAGELLASPAESAQASARTCRIINKSEHGYGIDWSDANMPGIAVSELICITPENNSGMYTLAVTRWLKNTDNGLLAGLEILSDDCRAVLFRAKKASAKHHPKKEYPGLLLSQNTEHGPQLIIPKGLFTDSEKIILTSDPQHEIQLELTRLVESTGMFERFETGLCA